MAYYVRENLPPTPILGIRRPMINEFFLSSYTLSIYAGCEFGCPYCDVWYYSSRPLNEMIRVPLDLPQRLAEELTDIDRGDLIGITTLSDPYQPVERTYGITRQVLQVFANVGQPCLILTKGVGILDDLPILRQIHERSLAIVMTTLLTVDSRLAERLEGKSPSPQLRLEMLRKCKQAGIPVGVVIAPVMPYVNDTPPILARLLRACADIGVDFVVWDYLHIPDRSHYQRINELILRVGNYPPGYYRELYTGETLPNKAYRSERGMDILQRCDNLVLDVRAPHKLYAGKLKPANEAALLLRHTAFLDAVQGRDYMAKLHRNLAALVYQETATLDDLRASPFLPTIQEILALPG
jgi:DNA repair photolyase